MVWKFLKQLYNVIEVAFGRFSQVMICNLQLMFKICINIFLYNIIW